MLSLSPRTSLLLASMATAAISVPTLQKKQSVCNGHAELCDRTYDNVTIVGAHDSYTDSTINPAADQELTITAMLNAGVRLLQAQAHHNVESGATSGSSNISLCHTSCALYDDGPIEGWLNEINIWLGNNPTDVVSLLMVNSDGVDPTVYDMAFESTGIKQYVYSPPSATLALGGWPTYGDLISAGTRLVSFMDSGANFASVPYIIDEFSNMWETPYDTTNSSFPCTHDRGNGDPTKTLGLINHYLDESIAGIDVPDKGALSTTNAPDDIISQANDCLANFGHYPTVLLLDFVDEGDPYTAANTLNGLS